MAMDDPWGSPWADETHTPHPAKSTNDDFAVKPTTPVKAASLALEQKTNSPWDDADDDGFGDWAVGNPEKETGPGLDGANDGWGSNVGNGLGSGFTIESSHALSGSWNNGGITPEDGTPKLGPSLFPKSSDIPRQPSPDPWAVGLDQENKRAEATTVPADRHGEGGIDGESMSHLSHNEEISQDAASEEVEDEVLRRTIETGDGISTEVEENNIIEELHESDRRRIEISQLVAISEQNGDIPYGEHICSRPSSSPSERSHRDEMTQDSPRTSLDEELKRPRVTRKVSTKVQELVEHFDGLAKQEEVAAPIVGRTGSPNRKTEDIGGVEEDEDEDEEMDDFGDFEDVQSETVEVEEPTVDGKADFPPRSPNVEDSKANSPEPVASPEKPKSRFVPKDLGPVEFTVDPTAFDRLYSGTESKTPPEKIFIPDVVPHDSFSSTEERKTWYRISRYGTMRKYNTGDDENYVRVNWTQSQVRTETLKIVARWIEEDRISGRVVLGGASKGSSIFGWNDSKAAPVPLAAAFAVNNAKSKAVPAASGPAVEIPREWPKGLVRTRSTSKNPSPSKSRRKSSTKSVGSEEAKPGVQLPVADFGWNVVPQSVQESKPQLPVHVKKLSGSSSSTPPPAGQTHLVSQSTAGRLSSPLATSKMRIIPSNGIAPRPHSIAHSSISLPPALSTPDIANDDDDWGELVSSPSTKIAPVLPPPSKSLHKTTGSLDSAFPLTAPIPQLTSAHLVQPKTEKNVGSASGSNGVLAEKRTASVGTNTPDKANQNDFTTSSNEYMTNTFTPTQSVAHYPVTTASVDPWASADFSFFETSAAPVSKPTTAPIPKSMQKSVTFSTPAVTSIPPRNQKSRDEVEQDRIVQNVVKGLPDLSYMLRK